MQVYCGQPKLTAREEAHIRYATAQTLYRAACILDDEGDRAGAVMVAKEAKRTNRNATQQAQIAGLIAAYLASPVKCCLGDAVNHWLMVGVARDLDKAMRGQGRVGGML